MRCLPVVVVGLVLALVIGCDERQADDQILAPPPSTVAFEPPEPGTYDLPPIQPAADGAVVAVDGTDHHLYDYLGDRLVLLSFIYTRCQDGSGCPLATATFQMLRRHLTREPEVADNLRFITLSFDPERDTSSVMQRFGNAVSDGEADEGSWAFLTTRSSAELQPVLDGYGQYIVPETDEEGNFLGTFAHVLKVYLIDRERKVRNIYSTSYLYPELVLNDVKTLLLEEAGTD